MGPILIAKLKYDKVDRVKYNFKCLHLHQFAAKLG